MAKQNQTQRHRNEEILDKHILKKKIIMIKLRQMIFKKKNKKYETFESEYNDEKITTTRNKLSIIFKRSSQRRRRTSIRSEELEVEEESPTVCVSQFSGVTIFPHVPKEDEEEEQSGSRSQTKDRQQFPVNILHPQIQGIVSDTSFDSFLDDGNNNNNNVGEDPWISFDLQRKESRDRKSTEPDKKLLVDENNPVVLLSDCPDGKQEVCYGDPPLTLFPSDSDSDSDSDSVDGDQEEEQGGEEKQHKDIKGTPWDEDSVLDSPSHDDNAASSGWTSRNKFVDLIENVFQCAPVEQKSPLRTYISKALHDDTIAIIGSKSEKQRWEIHSPKTALHYDEDKEEESSIMSGSESSGDTFKETNISNELYDEITTVDSNTLGDDGIIESGKFVFSCNLLENLFRSDDDLELYEI